MTKSAIVETVSKHSIIEINALEARIVASEDDADTGLWTQAEYVVKALETMSQRALAKQWINARTGEPYSVMHVNYTKQVIVKLALQVPRPRFRDAYNAIAHVSTAHVSHNSGENEWYTPEPLIVAARAVLGQIDLDPASSSAANGIVKARRYFTRDDDGLSQRWSGRVWMNPPYAQPLIQLFCEKLSEHYQAGDVSSALALVNNGTETAWFRSLADVSSSVCFPSGRVRFWSEDTDSAAPLQGQAIVYLGQDVPVFVKTFEPFGTVFVKP